MNTARKTAAKAPGKPFVKGNDPRRGVGVKGRSGRHPDAFKEMCRAAASSDETETAVLTILRNPKHPAFIGALKWATEHGYGAAPKSLDVTSGGKPISGVVVLPPTEGE